MIRASQETAINWAELDHRFCRMGLGTVLARYVGIAEALLGEPAPPLKCGPQPGAIEDFRRVIEPPGWLQPWERLVALAGRRRDPRGVLELFNPHELPKRVVKVFKRGSPTW